MPTEMEQKHESIMENHSDLLLKISQDVQEVKFILAGNKLNNYTGMVQDVSVLKEDVAELKDWKNSVQAGEHRIDDKQKKNHTVLSMAAAWIAAAIALASLIFQHRK
jgi:hypothetical protein